MSQQELENLSKVWEWASENLIQIKEDYGNIKTKEACALGALFYYATKGQKIRPTKKERWIYVFTNKDTCSIPLLIQAREFEKKVGIKISKLNDKQNLSFKDLADMAKEYGF